MIDFRCVDIKCQEILRYYASDCGLDTPDIDTMISIVISQ